MINKLIINTCFLLISCWAQAQLEVNSLDVTDSNLLEDLIIQELLGCDVEIDNVAYVGNAEAFGTFNYIQNDALCATDFSVLGLNRGLLLTTGSINYAVGPNNDGDDGQEWNVQYEDDVLHQYLVDSEVITPSVNLFDAAVLEFDITSSTFNSLAFEVVFGSEEYTEWMSPFYADAFCFFVSEINGDIDSNFSEIPQNIMETGDVLNIPNTVNDQFPFGCDIINKPISPWTIRPYSTVFNMTGLNECLYLENQDGVLCDAIGYDGYTVPMHFNLDLMPSATYRIKMVIVDGVSDYWAGLDSGVFIKKSDINNDIPLSFSWQNPEYSDIGALVSFLNVEMSNDNLTYLWDFDNDGNIDSSEINPVHLYEQPGSYIVNLQVVNNCTGMTESISNEIIINSSIDLNEDVTPFFISINPKTESVSFSFVNNNASFLVQFSDSSGRLISEKHATSEGCSIDFKKLLSGLYVVRVIDLNNQKEYYEKIIIL